MYAVIERESKKINNNSYPVGRGKAFFLSKYANNKSNVKAIVSEQVAKSISNDMKKMTNIMANNIIEGLVHGRR